MLFVAVVRSPSDDSAMLYVLPVLWMTSCFHMVAYQWVILYHVALVIERLQCREKVFALCESE